MIRMCAYFNFGYACILQTYESNVQLLSSLAWKSRFTSVFVVCIRQSVQFHHIMRDLCVGKKWAVTNDIDILNIFPANPFHVAIYLSSLVQTSLTVSPDTTPLCNLQ